MRPFVHAPVCQRGVLGFVWLLLCGLAPTRVSMLPMINPLVLYNKGYLGSNYFWCSSVFYFWGVAAREKSASARGLVMGIWA
jgi:hypothetical protein